MKISARNITTEHNELELEISKRSRFRDNNYGWAT